MTSRRPPECCSAWSPRHRSAPRSMAACRCRRAPRSKPARGPAPRCFCGAAAPPPGSRCRHINQRDVLRGGADATKRPSSTETHAMAHNHAINDDVHHQLQGPQGRAVVKQRSVYTIVTCLPIEADGRPRYRIKSKTENIERVVTEEQISRLDWSVLRF